MSRAAILRHIASSSRPGLVEELSKGSGLWIGMEGHRFANAARRRVTITAAAVDDDAERMRARVRGESIERAAMLLADSGAEKDETRRSSTGYAAGTSWDGALEHAVCEVVERHALLMSWQRSDVPVERIIGKPTAPYVHAMAALDLSAEYFAIRLGNLPAAVLCMCWNAAGGLACGASCSAIDSPVRLLDKACGEAIQVLRAAQLVATRQAGEATAPSSSRGSEHPGTLLGHVKWCFSNGDLVRKWYDEKAAGAVRLDDLKPSGAAGDAWLLREASISLGAVTIDGVVHPGEVPGWWVVRVRCAQALGMFDIGDGADNPRPHPFG